MDSEEEALDDLEFDGSSDDDEIDEDILDAIEGDLAAEEASEAAAEESETDDTDNGSDDENDEDEPPRAPPPPTEVQPTLPNDVVSTPPKEPSPRGPSPPEHPSHSVDYQRPLSPAGLRRAKLLSDLRWPRSFTVEAICAIPHPAPTHCLASSLCMSHLLTGSDDGYIRDYDIFSGVNGKVFLTAPQRHHCGVMEGLMKAAQIRLWWENPVNLAAMPGPVEEPPLSAPYSLLMHSDALWSLAGSEAGHINLFTVRHEPGRLCYIFPGHRGPVSSMSMAHDEKGFFSAGWDGEAIQWDLNTGQNVRNFTSHGAQLTSIGVRPLESEFTGIPWLNSSTANRAIKQEEQQQAQQQQQQQQPPPPPPPRDEDEQSDYDPLFDEPEENTEQPNPPQPNGLVNAPIVPSNPQPPQPRFLPAAPNAPPVLDPDTYTRFSPDILMTAAIDGQVMLWDRRVHSPGHGVSRLPMGEKTRPWCVSACWSADGSQIYVGRRNAIIDVWDVRLTGQAHMGTPRLLKTLRNPAVSGDVSCVVAFPDGRHLACASNDNIRLWNVAEAGEPDAFGKMKSGVQFKIIPGHHGGIISQMLVDRQARFLISASSNRGWHGESTKTVFVHEVKNIW